MDSDGRNTDFALRACIVAAVAVLCLALFASGKAAAHTNNTCAAANHNTAQAR